MLLPALTAPPSFVRCYNDQRNSSYIALKHMKHMVRAKDAARQLVQRLDRRVLETVLAQMHRQGQMQIPMASPSNDFDAEYDQTGDIYRVINYLTVKERLTVVPLVCRLWNELQHSPSYWLSLDFQDFACLGGWLQRRLRLTQLATGFITLLSDLGCFVLSIDFTNDFCNDVGFLKAVFRLCPNIVSLNLSGKAITSTVLEVIGKGRRMKALQICETARGKATPTDGFLRLLRRCPNLEQLGFCARLVSGSTLDHRALRWIRNSLRESRGSHLSSCLLTNLELKNETRYCGGLSYDAFCVLGDWFPELLACKTTSLIVGKMVQQISVLSRMRELSISMLSIIPNGYESESDLRTKAASVFLQVLCACPVLEDLRFGFSLVFNRPDVRSIILDHTLVSKMKRISLRFAGLEAGSRNVADGLIAPELQKLELRSCKISLTAAQQIASALRPSLRLQPGLDEDQYSFESS